MIRILLRHATNLFCWGLALSLLTLSCCSASCQEAANLCLLWLGSVVAQSAKAYILTYNKTGDLIPDPQGCNLRLLDLSSCECETES